MTAPLSVLTLHANATGGMRAQVCLQVDSGQWGPKPAASGRESNPLLTSQGSVIKMLKKYTRIINKESVSTASLIEVKLSRALAMVNIFYS